MKTIENNKEAIMNHLLNLSANELVNIHNDYCESFNLDYYIYSNDEYFFADFFSGNPMKLAKAISLGDYRYQDDFVMFNKYENLVSLEEDNILHFLDINAIAEDIIENPNDYYLPTLI